MFKQGETHWVAAVRTSIKYIAERARGVKLQMELVTGAAALLVLLLLTVLTFRLQKTKSRLPPGPKPWLFVGNVLQRDAVPVYKTYQKLSKKYGPVFTVWLGPKPLVVVSGYDAVKDVLVNRNDEFGGRPPIPIIDHVTKGYGLISEYAKWKELRRFTLSTLRNFGMGKKSMAERMQEEVKHLVEKLAESKGKPFDPVPDLTSAVSNVICSVVFGNRFSYDDKNFVELLQILKKFIGFFLSISGVIYSAMPKIMQPLPGPHKKIFADCSKICAFIRENVESHKMSLDPQNPRDYIDCFLLKLEKEQNSSQLLCMEDLVMSVFELFLAGTDSTTSNITYGILIVSNYPHIQEKLQKEIDEVIGTNRIPCMEDRVKLPYTNAVIHEIQRYQQGSSETFPRMTTQDVDFRGYFIPQDTIVLPLWVSAHFDPQYWDDPETFDPGHFLDEKGEFRRKDAFLPFSAGKRSCPGEALAQMEIFLFFVTLFQNFTFKAVIEPDKMELGSLFLRCREEGKHRYIQAIRRKS